MFYFLLKLVLSFFSSVYACLEVLPSYDFLKQQFWFMVSKVENGIKLAINVILLH